MDFVLIFIIDITAKVYTCITKIETMAQYDWAVKRVEELLPLVTDETPLDDSNSIELELLSNLVADYSEEHFALGEPTLVDVLKPKLRF